MGKVEKKIKEQNSNFNLLIYGDIKNVLYRKYSTNHTEHNFI